MKQLTLEEWVKYVFDRPVDETKLEWYWNEEADWWDCPFTDAIQFMTQAFENAEEVFRPYSDAQLKQGLWYIVSNACSNHMFALLDDSIPWSARQRCIRSFHPLYMQCFAERCTDHLSHLDEPGASPLNAVCYMWWDLIPLYGMPNEPSRRQIDEEVLKVLESTLHIDSIATCESALHGLGHWQMYYPDKVKAIIDQFLQKRTGLTEGLSTYALSARRGYVL